MRLADSHGAKDRDAEYDMNRILLHPGEFLITGIMICLKCLNVLMIYAGSEMKKRTGILQLSPGIAFLRLY